MQETNKAVVAAAAMEAMEEEEVELYYVKVGTRFYRVTTMSPSAGDRRRHPFHYLESCFLCKRSIACGRDVFMYRGEECREEQMDMDDALHAAARRNRLLLLLHLRAPEAASTSSIRAQPPVTMRRRPTIANLAARNPPVPAT